jgi:hypothetical protein
MSGIRCHPCKSTGATRDWEEEEEEGWYLGFVPEGLQLPEVHVGRSSGER